MMSIKIPYANRNNCVLAISVFMVFLCSCRENLNPTDYSKVMVSPKAGPIVSKVKKGFTFELQYRFPIYDALISLSNERINRDSLESRKIIFGSDHKFKLRLYPTDKSENVLKKGLIGREGYYERIQYFSSAVKNDFALITDNDTLYATHSSLERSYGLTPYIDLIVSFNKSKDQELQTLVFLDRALSKEKIEFNITEITKEKNYPKLKI